jgi:hypothetical protein
MPPEQVTIPAEKYHIHIPIWWDPIPPWLELKKGFEERFGRMEIEFRRKELQIEMEKLDQFAKLMG